MKKILSNFSWLLGGKLIRYCIGLFISIWIARYLKPSGYGILNYCNAYISFFTGIACLGIPQILVRQIVKNPINKHEIVGAGLLLMAFGGILSTCVCIGSIYIIRPGDSLTIILVSILSAKLLLIPYRTINSYYDSQLKSRINVVSGLVAYVLSSMLKVLALLYKMDIIYFAILISFETLITAILVFSYLRFKEKIRFKLSYSQIYFSQAKIILKDSFPLIFSIAATSLLLRIDQIMVRDLCNDHEAGIYAVAVKLTEVWYFIPIIIQTSVFPSVIKALKINEESFFRKLSKLFSIVILVGLSIAIPISFSSKFIIQLLYGESYIESSKILSVLIWAIVFIGINQIRNSFLYSKNYTLIHLKIVVLSLVINVFGNYFLIREYQGLGAAASTLITYFFASTVLNLLFKDSRIVSSLIFRSVIPIFSRK